MGSMTQARAAKQEILRLVAHTAGIMGIGISWHKDGQPYVFVNVVGDAKDRVRNRLPHRIEDTDILVEEVGMADIVAQGSDEK